MFITSRSVAPAGGREVGHDAGRGRVAGQVEELGADVAVQALQLERAGARARRRPPPAAGPPSIEKPELRVELAGRDVGVGRRLHAGRHPHQHALAHARGRRPRASSSGDLVEVVDHDRADAGVQRLADLARRPCCCRACGCARAGSRPAGRRKLAARGDVHRQALLAGPGAASPGRSRPCWRR